MLSTTLLAALALLAAPVPPARPLDVRPGAYSVRIGANRYATVLHADGSYESGGPDGDWHGSWRWDRDSRVLTIHECYRRPDYPRHWYTWRVPADGIERRQP